MEVILLKTGKEYMDEWREAVKDCKPSGQKNTLDFLHAHGLPNIK